MSKNWVLGVLAMFELAAVGAAAEFKAGAFAIDVTPALPISLNGGMTDRTARAIHDRLFARCFAMESGGVRAALVVVDSCMIPDDLIAEAKRRIMRSTKAQESAIIISATHTHTAPTLAPTFQSMPDRAYCQQLTEKISQGVEEAFRRLAPARVGAATADVPDQVFNRRWFKKPGTIPPNPFGNVDKVQMNPAVGDPNLVEPAGPTDPQVVAVSLVAADGNPIGLLANYSLHYVGDVPGDSVSADYFGAFARNIERRFAAQASSPPFVAAMSNGTSGNVNNVDFRNARPKLQTFGRCELVAERTASAIVKALPGVNYQSDSPIRFAHRDVSFSVRKPDAAEISRARGIVEAVKGRPLQGLQEIYAGETVDVAEYPDSKTIRIQAMRIGSIGVVAIPCEVFVEIGLRIKSASPFTPTFVMSLANGYSGYLPTAEHHALGGYETWRAKSSFLEVGAAEKVVGAATGMLQELHRAP